jgi:hypothetical protein
MILFAGIVLGVMLGFIPGFPSKPAPDSYDQELQMIREATRRRIETVARVRSGQWTKERGIEEFRKLSHPVTGQPEMEFSFWMGYHGGDNP